MATTLRAPLDHLRETSGQLPSVFVSRPQDISSPVFDDQNRYFQPQHVIPTVAVVVFVPKSNQSVSIEKKQASKLDPQET